jgi:hypothetical protein
MDEENRIGRATSQMSTPFDVIGRRGSMSREPFSIARWLDSCASRGLRILDLNLFLASRSKTYLAVSASMPLVGFQDTAGNVFRRPGPCSPASQSRKRNRLAVATGAVAAQ